MTSANENINDIRENSIKPGDIDKAANLSQHVKRVYFVHGISDLCLGFALLLVGLTNFGTRTNQVGIFLIGLLIPGLAIFFLNKLRSLLVRKYIDTYGYVVPRFPFALYSIGLLVIAVILIAFYGVKSTYPVVVFGALLYATILIAVTTGLIRFWFYFIWTIVSYLACIYGYTNKIEYMAYPWLSFSIIVCILCFIWGGLLLLDYLKKHTRVVQKLTSEELSGGISNEK